MTIKQMIQAWILCGLLLLVGCSQPHYKQTWQDWMEPSDPNQPATAMLVSPELPADNHELRLAEGYEIGDGAHVGPGFNLKMRNPDFPNTYIDAVYLNVTSPDHWLRVSWTGPQATLGPVGPWHANNGRGKSFMDCNDVVMSNTVDSWCTPKGVFPAAGFDDQLTGVLECHYVTWVIHEPRFIGLHSHWSIPVFSASHGCIRVPYDVAQLIHNNSRVGLTLIHIDGNWTRHISTYEQEYD